MHTTVLHSLPTHVTTSVTVNIKSTFHYNIYIKTRFTYVYMYTSTCTLHYVTCMYIHSDNKIPLQIKEQIMQCARSAVVGVDTHIMYVYTKLEQF